MIRASHLPAWRLFVIHCRAATAGMEGRGLLLPPVVQCQIDLRYEPIASSGRIEGPMEPAAPTPIWRDRIIAGQNHGDFDGPGSGDRERLVLHWCRSLVPKCPRHSTSWGRRRLILPQRAEGAKGNGILILDLGGRGWEVEFAMNPMDLTVQLPLAEAHFLEEIVGVESE